MAQAEEGSGRKLALPDLTRHSLGQRHALLLLVATGRDARGEPDGCEVDVSRKIEGDSALLPQAGLESLGKEQLAGDILQRDRVIRTARSRLVCRPVLILDDDVSAKEGFGCFARVLNSKE